MGLPRAIAVLLAATLVCWLASELAPGDVKERAARVAGLLPPEGVLVDAGAKARAIDAAARARGVGDSAWERLVRTGPSWRDGRPVGEHLAAAWPTTLWLLGQSLLLVLILGLGAGLLRRGDHVVGLVTAAALAVPVAWLCLFRVWAPLCLALAAAAALARVVRAELLGLEGAGFVLAARARGASPAWHALAAAGASLVSYLPALVGWLLGAAPVVERAFGRPGVGALFLDAAARGDAPIVRGVVLSSTALVLAVSLGSGWIARRLDPRAP